MSSGSRLGRRGSRDGGGDDPRPAAKRAADAARPDRDRRGARAGGAGSADRAQHRPRRRALDRPRELPGGRAAAARDAGADGGRGAAPRRDPRAGGAGHRLVVHIERGARTRRRVAVGEVVPRPAPSRSGSCGGDPGGARGRRRRPRALAAREALLRRLGCRRVAPRGRSSHSRAGREGYAPSAAERRRLGALVGAALLFAGPGCSAGGPAAPLAAAGPAAASGLGRAARRGPLPARVEARARIAATPRRRARGRPVPAPRWRQRPARSTGRRRSSSRVRADLELGARSRRSDRAPRRIRSQRWTRSVPRSLSQQIAGGGTWRLCFAASRRLPPSASGPRRTRDQQLRRPGSPGLLVARCPVAPRLLAELLAPGFVAGLIRGPLAGAARRRRPAGGRVRRDPPARPGGYPVSPVLAGWPACCFRGRAGALRRSAAPRRAAGAGAAAGELA